MTPFRSSPFLWAAQSGLALIMLLSSAAMEHPAPASTGRTPWLASWIGAPASAPGEENTSKAAAALPIFRRKFQVREPVARAELRISGLGQYEALINGQMTTDSVLNSAWSDYRKRVYYNTWDVTQLVKRGVNVIGVMLGNGMYNVVETRGRYTKFAGSFGEPALILQLTITFRNGTTMTVSSDGAWKTSPGPITFDSVYGGEDYDARLEQPGWDEPGFDDTHWRPVSVNHGPGGKLIPESIPLVKAFDLYRPIGVTHPRPGVTVYDFGENSSGWPEIEVTGQRGAVVTLIPGELLDGKGLVTQRSAAASPAERNSFSYVLKGGGPEKWHPQFSYYGFRYMQAETSGEVAIVQIDARFLHDAVSVDGQFSSSDPLLNAIHALINRAMLSNMMSVLTDCPHREKLGWLEQSHLAGASLMYNFNLKALYAKIADDMQDAQLTDGLVPDIAPEFTVFERGFRDSPEWGSAIILSSWKSYQFYGNLSILRDHYAGMQRYVTYLQGRSYGNLLGYGLGDWYDIGPNAPGESQLTAKGVTATAVFYQDLSTMGRIAALLGRPQEAQRYTGEAEQVRRSFNARFFDSERYQYDSGSQSANAMALALDLVPESQRQAVLANLIADIRMHGNHVTAGDIGFHYVVLALMQEGRSDVLYDMFSRTDRPSYGYQLARGATALTEAWDANPNSSQNHFMLGHAEEWFYRGLGGIDFDMSRSAGERIRIRPAIVGDLTYVSATYRSTSGRIGSTWSRAGRALNMEVTIPPGSSGELFVPDGYKLVSVNGKPPRFDRRLRMKEAVGRPAILATGGVWQIKAERASTRQPDDCQSP
jgi:alpha-L-rhamnosidase